MVSASGMTVVAIIGVLAMALDHTRFPWRYDVVDLFPPGRAGLEEDAAKLCELVEKELELPDLQSSGVAISGTTLIADTSLGNHLRLAKLLAQFRAAIGDDRLVEVHTFRAPEAENFLDEIGPESCLRSLGFMTAR